MKTNAHPIEAVAVIASIGCVREHDAGSAAGQPREGTEARRSVQGVALDAISQATSIIVVVITGPIASGKSTLGRAVAIEFSARGLDSAAVDLDLVYEMLDPRREPKTDQSCWTEARRLAGKIAAGLLGQRQAVVVEGEFETKVQRANFCDELPSGLRASFVTLTLNFDEAWRRAMVDPTRGVSQDREFLAAHYRARGHAIPADGDLVLDTGDVSVAVAARSVADWVLEAKGAPD